MLVSVGILILTVVAGQALLVPLKNNETCLTPDPNIIERNWADISPYFAQATYEPPPSHCHITQVNILQRHGARFPTGRVADQMKPSLAKLQSAKNFTECLRFLPDYTYTMGEDDLLSLGVRESKESGEETYHRYSHLLSHTNIPFIRACGLQRVIDSAGNWSLGMAEATNGGINPTISVIISEAPGSKNTLHDMNCPKRMPSSPTSNIWKEKYARPIAERLNAQAPGASLEPVDAFNIMQLCAHDTVTRGSTSPFCNLFTEEEFEQAEYVTDLDRFYLTGYGQGISGRIQGVGYVNELLARLTEKPVEDDTQTNYTLDHDPTTFPLGRTMYADFAHDNMMVAIFSTLGLFEPPELLDPRKPDPKRTFVISQIVPFSGRMVVERLACQENLMSHNGPGDPTGIEDRFLRVQSRQYALADVKPDKQDMMIRILVNDAVQPLEFCGASKETHYMCSLDAFVESQSYAADPKKHREDWEKCGFEETP